MKYFFRRIIIGVLWAWHLLAVLAGQKPHAVVLMYHSVSESGWFFSVSPEEFDRQMRYIKEYYTPVRLRDIVDFLDPVRSQTPKASADAHVSPVRVFISKGAGRTSNGVEGKRPLPNRAVAVTFDDGYKDFETHALPILERYGIPATVFVTVGEVDRKEMGNYLPLLGWDGIRDIGKSNLVEIGSHALTHKKLTRLPPEDAKNEIVSSGIIIERKTRLRPQFFAYPKGSFNDTIMDMVARAGYRGAVSATHLLAAAETNRFAIPRIQIDRSTSFFEFRAKLTNASDWYYWLWSIKEKSLRLFLS